MTTTATYDVLGDRVTVPMHIARARASLGVFTADADAIAGRLPDELVPVRLTGGTGLVLVMAVAYVDNPLGAYDELVVGLVARPSTERDTPVASGGALLRGRFGAWIEHMAVSQPFTREAGEVVWGYPKTLDELAWTPGSASTTLRWARDDQHIASFSCPTRGALPAPALPFTTYTHKDGVVHATTLRARVRGVGVAPLGARLTLGEHPVADGLRALGIGRRPVTAAWLDRVAMDFSVARPLATVAA